MAANSGIILDTGPLVAYLVDDEQHHDWATEQFSLHDGPLVTAEAVISEAWFLLRRTPRHLRQLTQMLADGVFNLSFHLKDEGAAVSALMDRYDNVPMSLADACLVRLSELHPKLPLVTLDSDFKVYRRHGRQFLPVVAPR